MLALAGSWGIAYCNLISQQGNWGGWERLRNSPEFLQNDGEPGFKSVVILPKAKGPSLLERAFFLHPLCPPALVTDESSGLPRNCSLGGWWVWTLVAAWHGCCGWTWACQLAGRASAKGSASGSPSLWTSGFPGRPKPLIWLWGRKTGKVDRMFLLEELRAAWLMRKGSKVTSQCRNLAAAAASENSCGERELEQGRGVGVPVSKSPVSSSYLCSSQATHCTCFSNWYGGTLVILKVSIVTKWRPTVKV